MPHIKFSKHHSNFTHFFSGYLNQDTASLGKSVRFMSLFQYWQFKLLSVPIDFNQVSRVEKTHKKFTTEITRSVNHAFSSLAFEFDLFETFSLLLASRLPTAVIDQLLLLEMILFQYFQGNKSTSKKIDFVSIG